ncbi:hypothetical protein C8J57DRAFT_241085 [Mycena rebaudengoi]|nr:hypothetical protein C8J57DRAFT_241085 [Mycena rebaudengoi]
MNAEPALRGKHILIGLTDACSIARNLHDTRIYCGRELRLSHLQGDGRVVLDMLKSIMVEDILKVPEEPKYIPNTAWDSFADVQRRSVANDSEKLALASILLLRTKLICHFMHSTIRSFLGLELPEIKVKKNRKHNSVAPSILDRDMGISIMEQMLGRAGAKAAIKDNKDAWKERQSKRKEYCSYRPCSATNNDEVKFSRCKKCWDEMKREVLYCSVECQKADWKLHHKAICGKQLSFDAISKRVPDPIPTPGASVSSPPVVGPPIGSYKRSSALMYQIAELKQRPECDYVLLSDSLAEPIFLDFPDPEAQSLFQKSREKAMTTGDRQSVAVMAHFLCWMTMEDKSVVGKGATANVIVGQMKKEYVFDELHLAVREMQQRQNRDPFKRPLFFFPACLQRTG